GAEASAGAAVAAGHGAAARLTHARALARLGRAEKAAVEARALLDEDPDVGAARGLLLDLAASPPRARP
ncbi:MAG TPA: hypothetical protein VFP50_21115, partial [Anaeromyxobacteraceae bacterium]|nr:hypothetical protein [Anaeromyxobacteraceae bacterium]